MPNERPRPPAPTLRPTQAAGRATQRQARQATLDVLDAPAQQIQTNKTARLALALRQLATAAAALQRLPNGGKAADALHKILDTAVNKGGRFHVKNGKLARTTPPAVTGLGDSWLVQVAPWALTSVTKAVQAARVGLGRFGDGLHDNLKTATAYAAGKIAPLLDKMADVPGFGQAAGLVRQAMNNAGALLGVTASTRPAREFQAVAVRPAAKHGTSKAVVYFGKSKATRKPGQPFDSAPAPAAVAPGVRPPPPKSGIGTGAKILLAAGVAALVVPKLLKH